jgi:hypothetical protein
MEVLDWNFIREWIPVMLAIGFVLGLITVFFWSKDDERPD